MSSVKPAKELNVSAERNGECAEETSTNGVKVEPQNLPDVIALETDEVISIDDSDDEEPEQCEKDAAPADKKDDVPEGEQGDVPIDKMDDVTADGQDEAPKDKQDAAPAGKQDEASLDNEENAEKEDDDETMPEDLNDFVVLDEAEITDSEGEDSVNDDDDEESMQWDCPLERLASRTYTDKDLEPTVLDPRCKPNWPLAAYWPVYVGNFRLFKKFDSDYNCAHAVQKYFASKGLPAFMVYRLKDAFFEEYQKRVGFYDMLVYFCNKKDAGRAIKWCNRDLYYGHRLNVFCGRTLFTFPTFPDKKFKSYRFKHKKTEDMLESESSLEKYFNSYGKVVCISKQHIDSVLVQFVRTPRPERFPNDSRVQLFKLTRSVSKQRFVESKIEKQLTKEIENNPRFMRSRLSFKLLESIKHGVIPEMPRPWEKPEMGENAAEQRRQANRRSKTSYNGPPPPARNTFKRKIDDIDNDPSRNRRQLIREAQSLEFQLMRLKNQINDGGNSAPPQIPLLKNAIRMAVSELAPKRQKTENQILRQQIRGARRTRNRQRDMLIG